MPKASVIMTSYNTPEDYLCAAIESILNQTYKDFEFIIVDDCSAASIEPIVKSYNDSRIIFIRNKENLGVTGAPNVGIDMAKGEYIFRMDSDDISHPTRLEKQIDFLDKNSDIDVLGTSFEKFPKKKVIKQPLENKEIKYTMLFSNSAICNPSCAIRKSAIDRLNMRYNNEHKVCEDYGMWLNYINELKFANLDEVLLNYRWHKQNISKKNTKVQSTGAQYLMLEAQAKHFGTDAKDALAVIDKFKNNQTVTSKDLEIINSFVLDSKNRLKAEYSNFEYNVNRNFYKMFLKSCIRDINFIKILFSKELDDIIKLSFFQKIAIAFGL